MMLLLFTRYGLCIPLSGGREPQQYLMSVRAQGDTESSCESKISQLDYSCFVNEQVLRLQVPVDDSM